MDSPDILWTLLFCLIAVGIVIFFAQMVRKSLNGGACNCESGACNTHACSSCHGDCSQKK